MSGHWLTLAKAGATAWRAEPGLAMLPIVSKLRMQTVRRDYQHADGRSSAPLNITIKPTLQCNLHCEMCSTHERDAALGPGDHMMTLSTMKRVVDDAAKMACYISLTGGEPLLNKSTPTLIRYIKQKGLTCVMTSNATFLDARAQEVIDSGLDILVVSIDGAEPVHDRVRKLKGAYQRSLRSVRRMQEIQKQQRKRSPLLVISSAITPTNYDRCEEMVGVAKEFGAFCLNLQHLWYVTDGMVQEHNKLLGDYYPISVEEMGGMGPEGVDTDQLYDTIERLKCADAGLPIHFYPDLSRDEMAIYYLQPEKRVTDDRALCAWVTVDVLPNGDVSPCIGGLTVGNVKEQSFREIWNGERYREYRRRLKENGAFPICTRCCAYFRRN